MENILFLINHAGKAGTERYVRTLAEGAAAYDMRPFFVYNEPGQLSEQMSVLCAGCRQLPMRGPFDLAAARGLARICEDWKIGIIHTNFLRENYIAILCKILFHRYIKVIYTNHFVTVDNLAVKLANRFMTRADHKIISVCEAGAPNLIRNGVAKKSISVIHNGVDPMIWRPGADYRDIRASARNALGIGADEIVILCASRLAHDKGHSYLLDSLERLADTRGLQQMRVLLAGDGPLEADIRDRVDELGLSGTVIMLGFVKDIKSLFYAADFYVNPSQHEALSFLILEALASGLPVIATDMGGNREIVNARSGCGALVPYGDTAALRDAIQAYRTDGALLEMASLNALHTIESKFSLADMLVKTFASFY